jgi:hypothetical protein
VGARCPQASVQCEAVPADWRQKLASPAPSHESLRLTPVDMSHVYCVALFEYPQAVSSQARRAAREKGQPQASVGCTTVLGDTRECLPRRVDYCSGRPKALFGGLSLRNVWSVGPGALPLWASPYQVAAFWRRDFLIIVRPTFTPIASTPPSSTVTLAPRTTAFPTHRHLLIAAAATPSARPNAGPTRRPGTHAP